MAMRTFHLIVDGDDSGPGAAFIPELDLEVYEEYGGACAALEKLADMLDTAAGAVTNHLWHEDPEAFEHCDGPKLCLAQKLIEMFGKKDAASE